MNQENLSQRGARWRKPLFLLADLRVSAILILLFAIEVLWGTLLQGKWGLYAAQEAFFHHWFARIPFGEDWYLPFIGVPLLGALAVINLMASMVVRLRWKLQNAGLLLLHAGLIALLVSAGLSMLSASSGMIDLAPGESTKMSESEKEWELVLRAEAQEGASLWIVDANALSEGQILNLGAILPHAEVTFSNAQAGDPTQWTPQVQLKVADKLFNLTGDAAPLAIEPGRMLYIRRIQHALPFELQLKKFVHEMHPNSNIAARYESTVKIADAQGERVARISMNEPLRIGEYTIYQSSWREGLMGEKHSILAVVQNPWRTAPYWATLVIGLGFLLHTLRHVRQALQSKKILALLVLLPFVNQGHAQEMPSQFFELAIQIDGRAKPLEAYARNLKLQISGSSRGAQDWFARSLLGDSTIDTLPVFLVENLEVRNALGLQGKVRDRYTWKSLANLGFRLDSLARKTMLVPDKSRNAAEKDLLRVADSWNRYYALRHALDAIASSPLYHNIPQGLPPLQNFLDFTKAASILGPRIDHWMKVPADSLDATAKAQLDWISLALQEAQAASSVEFSIIPVFDTALTFQSPTALLLQKGPETSIINSLNAWAKLRQAWLERNSPNIELSVAELQHLQGQILQAHGFRSQALVVEAWYYRLDIFFKALLLLGIALALAILQLWKGHLWVGRAAVSLLALAWTLTAVGMALRMFITLRPPATNLYDTFVFSTFVAIPLAWGIGYVRRLSARTVLAAGIGFALLFLARRHGMNGDTMPVLAAVLNSNFWLTLHVLSITIGYAGVVVAGAYAHWHIWLYSKVPGSSEELSAYRALRLLIMLGLFFTFVGTLLGAIWADQSWGRFWGWDPKENGALIIILWLAFLFHALPCGWIGRRGFAWGSIFAIQTVLFAWFGVNLMGVGLHSYGFTQGTLYGLLGFAGAELAFVLLVARYAKISQTKE